MSRANRLSGPDKFFLSLAAFIVAVATLEMLVTYWVLSKLLPL